MKIGLLTSARRKNDLSKKVKKHQSNLNLRRFYNTYRNKFNSIDRLAKIHFYKKKFSKVQCDPKRTWNLVNKIIGLQNTKNSDEILENIAIDDNIYDPKKHPFDTANAFNDYFAIMLVNYNRII